MWCLLFFKTRREDENCKNTLYSSERFPCECFYIIIMMLQPLTTNFFTSKLFLNLLFLAHVGRPEWNPKMFYVRLCTDSDDLWQNTSSLRLSFAVNWAVYDAPAIQGQFLCYQSYIYVLCKCCYFSTRERKFASSKSTCTINYHPAKQRQQESAYIYLWAVLCE